ncbi:hypothetical protein F4809DRAFT_116842 [Biscogniauxia mediterranea]|nr:hypothetical protein F4809DRAFT_116842 [Biscogniauxia mediterranea]
MVQWFMVCGLWSVVHLHRLSTYSIFISIVTRLTCITTIITTYYLVEVHLTLPHIVTYQTYQTYVLTVLGYPLR